MTADELVRKGFDRNIVSAIEEMTKRRDEDYGAYPRRVKSNCFAHMVKLADLRHNGNLKRLRSVAQKDIDRVGKYQRTIQHPK